MSELAALAESRRNALVNDLATFANIVESTAAPLGNADSWAHPATSAAHGLGAGWEALVSPDGSQRMPELHRRVMTYLGQSGVKKTTELQPSIAGLTLAAPDVLLQVYGRLPQQKRQNAFVEGVIRDAKKLKGGLSPEANRERKKIVKGMRWVLGVEAAFTN